MGKHRKDINSSPVHRAIKCHYDCFAAYWSSWKDSLSVKVSKSPLTQSISRTEWQKMSVWVRFISEQPLGEMPSMSKPGADVHTSKLAPQRNTTLIFQAQLSSFFFTAQDMSLALLCHELEAIPNYISDIHVYVLIYLYMLICIHTHT